MKFIKRNKFKYRMKFVRDCSFEHLFFISDQQNFTVSCPYVFGSCTPTKGIQEVNPFFYVRRHQHEHHTQHKLKCIEIVDNKKPIFFFDEKMKGQNSCANRASAIFFWIVKQYANKKIIYIFLLIDFDCKIFAIKFYFIYSFVYYFPVGKSSGGRGSTQKVFKAISRFSVVVFMSHVNYLLNIRNKYS